MKIYFAGSIKGGRGDVDLYYQIIEHLRHYGQILTEHVGDQKIDQRGDMGLSPKEIHDRDIDWLLLCDLVVAEVTIPSLGVGYEIAKAVEHKKKVLCLFRNGTDKHLSSMIDGCPDLKVVRYNTIEEANKSIDNFIKVNPTKRKNIVKAAAAIINDQGELLIVKKGNRPNNPDIFINPGGRRRAGETHTQTLKRELKEELSVDLTEVSFFKTYHSEQAAHDPGYSVILHLFLVKWQGEINPAGEVTEAVWLNKQDLEFGKYQLAQFFEKTIPDLREKGLIKI